MSTPINRGNQRIGYYQGQLLKARDLQDDVAYQARLRGLHVRAMHNTWGVALGFDVRRKGEALVEVGPGIAYDCHGREIVSVRTLIAAPPPPPPGSQADAWWFDLVIGYLEGQDLAGGMGLGSSCFGAGVSPLEERPAWRWVFVADAADASAPPPLEAGEEVRLGEEVPLARFRISAEGAVSQPDFGPRRNAQGLVRPHIAGGQVEGDLLFAADLHAWTTQVDTSAAGFSETPFYFARLAIPRFLEPSLLTPEWMELLRHLAGPLVAVRDPGREAFHLDARFALLPAKLPGATTFSIGGMAEAISVSQVSVSRLPVTISWVGIEPTGGCPPPPSLVFFFLFAQPFFTQIGSFIPFQGTSLVMETDFSAGG